MNDILYPGWRSIDLAHILNKRQHKLQNRYQHILTMWCLTNVNEFVSVWPFFGKMTALSGRPHRLQRNQDKLKQQAASNRPSWPRVMLQPHTGERMVDTFFRWVLCGHTKTILAESRKHLSRCSIHSYSNYAFEYEGPQKCQIPVK